MKRNFKNLLFVFFFLFVLSSFKNKVFAAKVLNGTVQFGDVTVDASEFLNHRPILSNKTIKEVCRYERADKESGTVDSKELLIYTDNTASIYWGGVLCERFSSDQAFFYQGRTYYHCVDGDTNGQGIRNWKKNDSGVDKNLKNNLDAAAWYEENNDCPAFLTQSEKWGSNYFYLSTGSTKTDYNSIKNAAKKLGGTSYYYYNAGNTSESFSGDLSCSYSSSKEGSDSIEIEFSSNGASKVKNINGLKYDNYNIAQAELNSRITSPTYLNLIEKGKCPKTLNTCLAKADLKWYEHILGALSTSQNVLTYIQLWSDSTRRKLVIYGDTSIVGDFCSPDNQKYLYCQGDNCSEKSICQAYSDLEGVLEQDLNDYKSASQSDKAKILNTYNDHRDQLNEYCVSALKAQNYAEGTCIDMCLNLSKSLADIEAAAGLRNPYAESKCNIGMSIINMAYNVLKWAKYILPALVIILTMLDFIKAIAAQNDDDMKKAQGKFVKRLIIAALLFLLPLIINFVLQTFGFYNSSCDITELF